MDTRDHVAIQTADFDVSQELAALRRTAGPDASDFDGEVGAVACFVGTVRDREGSATQAEVSTLELEHYPGMTERSIQGMVQQARQRFPAVRRVRVIHRVGALKPCAQIVMVAVASAHRGEAFAACEFLMDYLKTQAPFWKKEHRPDGTSQWVDARVSDDVALRRWGIQADNAGGVVKP